ncbi:MAG: hypothetical protein ACSHWU_05635 [Marinicella sp.]
MTNENKGKIKDNNKPNIERKRIAPDTKSDTENVIFPNLLGFIMEHNASIRGKKQLVIISDAGAKPTVFCPAELTC